LGAINTFEDESFSHVSLFSLKILHMQTPLYIWWQGLCLLMYSMPIFMPSILPPFSSAWRCKQHGPLKHWYPTIVLHVLVIQKTTLWNFIAVKISILAPSIMLWCTECISWQVRIGRRMRHYVVLYSFLILFIKFTG